MAAAEQPGPAPRPRRHLGGGAAVSVIADVGPLAAAGALSIVLARAVGPSGNGKYALLATLVNTAVLVFSLGLAAGVTYQVSRGRWRIGQAFRDCYGAAVVLGMVGIAAGLGFYALTRGSVLRAFDLSMVLLALSAIPALLASQFASAALLGDDRYEAYGAVLLTTSAVTLVAGAGLAIPYGVTGALVGFVAAAVAAAAVGALLLKRAHAADHAHALQAADSTGRGAFREAVRFSLPGWIGNIFQQANYRFDVIILGAYASTARVGVYSVAVTIAGIAWVLPHGLQTVIFPRTATLDAAAQAGELTAQESDAAVTRGTRHTVLLLVPSGLIVAALLALVPLVYGHRFDETVALGFVLLPGVLALGVGKVLGSVVAGRGKPRYNLYTGVVVAALTLTLYVTLIPALDEWGAALASSISYLMTTVIAAAFFRRLLRVSLTEALIPTAGDVRNYREAVVALRAHLRSRRTGHRAA